MCIPLLWEKTVSKFPRRTAIIDAESGRKLTFDELNQFSNAVYNVLKENGAGKSDGVALIMPNCVEYGYSRIALVSNNINFQWILAWCFQSWSSLSAYQYELTSYGYELGVTHSI